MKNLKNFNTFEAVKTECQTPGTQYQIDISDKAISVNIELPMKLDIDEEEAKLLESNLHNAIEIVLSKYFTDK
jgi:hypothetical protein